MAGRTISSPRSAPSFQLPALTIPHSSLTEGTSIPPPPLLPPPSPPADLDGRNPLRSHPTSSHASSPATSHVALGLHGPPAPATPNGAHPAAAAGPGPAKFAPSHKRNPTNSSLSPPAKKRSLLGSAASVASGGSTNPIRKFLSRRSLGARHPNPSSDSLVAASPASAVTAPEAPGSPGAGAHSPSLRRRASGAFWRKASLFSLGGGAVAEEEEASGGAGPTAAAAVGADADKENAKRKGTPPPMLPELEKLGSRDGPAGKVQSDGWLDGQMFKDIQ